ncbi:hypothetical protein [Fuerstiella marisgermanici]|uniref:Lipoprotein n=1 Tax=Fuerstiella marisgermanici TaxID=1891926 RepID=A0A1P8WIL8_9PLAN|nr:hypothetical protein [Fuerstiella marisgermanici]APZ93891.1 hypothetical protein Fuma_03509 [Fuerstiella marisgermanici]
MTRLILATLLLGFTGCQQARSFLHMNSDSPSPFLGFELSVDARDVHDSNAVQLRHADDTPMNSATTIKAVRSNTREEKYALPLMDLASHPVEAAEIDDIMSRIAGS